MSYLQNDPILSTYIKQIILITSFILYNYYDLKLNEFIDDLIQVLSIILFTIY